MKKLQKSVIFFTMFLSITLAACGQKTKWVLSADEFGRKLKETKDAQLVDVRTPEEYNEGHLKGAGNVDWNGDNFEEHIAKLDKNKPAFVYCLAGSRSAAAAEKMRKMGFKEVYEMQGGIMQWKEPLVKAEGQENKPQGMTEADLEKIVKENTVVLVDFNATWCIPCQKLAPMLKEIEEEQKGKVKVLPIDVDKNKDLAMKKSIYNIPFLILYKNGQPVWNAEGYTEKQVILDAIEGKK